MGIAALVVLVIVLLILLRSVRIASEWQRAVVLRLGRFHQAKGPGLYLLFPLIDWVAQVIDLRILTTTITAEQALTGHGRGGGGCNRVLAGGERRACRHPHRQLQRGGRARGADQPARDDRLHRPVAFAIRPQNGGRAIACDDRRQDHHLGCGGAQRRDQGRFDPRELQDGNEQPRPRPSGKRTLG